MLKHWNGGFTKIDFQYSNIPKACNQQNVKTN
jgi:hypothetical protein